MIKAVCFDFDGTLAQFTGDFALLADGLRSDLGLTQCDANTLSARRAQVERRGGVTTFGSTVRAALEELELRAPDDLEQLAAQVVEDYSAQMALLPGALDVLNFCRNQELPLALLTNGPADMQRAAVRAVGLECFFKRLLVSGDADVAVRKPNPRIFGLACEALGARPAETLMVGDDLGADVKGALAYRMQAVYLGSELGTGYETLPDVKAFGRWLEMHLCQDSSHR